MVNDTTYLLYGTATRLLICHILVVITNIQTHKAIVNTLQGKGVLFGLLLTNRCNTREEGFLCCKIGKRINFGNTTC